MFFLSNRKNEPISAIGGDDSSYVETFDGENWRDLGPFDPMKAIYRQYKSTTIDDTVYLFGNFDIIKMLAYYFTL